jgi:hypothetical protein
VSFAAITLCAASQQVIPKVSLYFFIDSDRKLLDTHSYGKRLCREYFNLPSLNVAGRSSFTVNQEKVPEAECASDYRLLHFYSESHVAVSLPHRRSTFVFR